MQNNISVISMCTDAVFYLLLMAENYSVLIGRLSFPKQFSVWSCGLCPGRAAKELCPLESVLRKALSIDLKSAGVLSLLGNGGKNCLWKSYPVIFQIYLGV